MYTKQYEYTEQDYEDCVLGGLKQMPLIALERCIEVCDNRPDDILMTGAIGDFDTNRC